MRPNKISINQTYLKMEPLSELLKSMKAIQQKTNSFYGINTIQDYISQIENSPTSIVLKATNSFPDIAKSISDPMIALNKASLIFPNNIFNHVSESKRLGATAFSSLYSDVFSSKESLYESLSKITASQNTVTNSLNRLFQYIDNLQPLGFNTLNNAVLGLSNTYLRDIADRHQWQDAEILKEANETITSVADNYTSNKSIVTIEDLVDFHISIINEFQKLFSKSKSEKIKLFLRDLIALIGIIIALHTSVSNSGDISNKETVNLTTSEIQKAKKEFLEQLDIELRKLNKTRIAQTNVNLMFSNSKRAKVIGLVVKDQNITVIEIRHKWLLITYIDDGAKEPKSGFVFKKYFKVEK